MGTRAFVAGVAIGAGVAYLADPRDGPGRRARMRDWLDRSGELSPGASLGSGAFEIGERHYGSRAGDIQGLDAATLLRRGDLKPDRRGRVARRTVGAALVLWGFTRRGRAATVARSLGAGLLFRRDARPPEPAATGYDGLGARRAPDERRRVMDIQKTLYIDAPPDQVYAFWSNCANFPLFMSSVREVEDLGGGRSRWSVSGPGGAPIDWLAVVTQATPEEVIAWRSEPGSMLENAGVIRLRPEDSGTRVDLRICYNPPAGGGGRAVIELLGSDPREMLNDDLSRLKTLLEASGRSSTLEERGT